MFGVCKLYIFAGVQVDKRAGGQLHAGLVRGIHLNFRWNHLAKRNLVGLIRFLDENREHGRHHSGGQLCVREAAQLLQTFQHRGQQRHTAYLTGAVTLHQTQDVLPPGLCAVGFHSRPV